MQKIKIECSSLIPFIIFNKLLAFKFQPLNIQRKNEPL